MSAEPIEPKKLSWYVQLRDAAAAGDKTAAKKFARLKKQQSDSRKRKRTTEKDILNTKQAKAERRAAKHKKHPVHFPLGAIPDRPQTRKRVRTVMAHPAAQRMTVAVKAGSQIAVTIGGVSVTIIAEA